MEDDEHDEQGVPQRKRRQSVRTYEKFHTMSTFFLMGLESTGQ